MEIPEKDLVCPLQQIVKFTGSKTHPSRDIIGCQMLVVAQDEHLAQVNRHFLKGMYDIPKQSIATLI